MALISLDGNIGAGKTTLLQKLKTIPTVKVIEEPVDTWSQFNVHGKTILQYFYEDTPRWAYTFQNAAILTRILHIQKSIQENPGYTYYITERSVLTDKHVFASMLHKDGILNDMEMKLYEMWFDNFGKIQTVSGILWLTTDVDTCVERIKLRGRSGEENISRDYLEKLHAAHKTWFEHETNPVYAIDCNMSSDDLYDTIKSLVPKVPE